MQVTVDELIRLLLLIFDDPLTDAQREEIRQKVFSQNGEVNDYEQN